MPSVEAPAVKVPEQPGLELARADPPTRTRHETLRPPGAAHRFLAVFSVISPHFRPRRHRLTADDYRTEVADRLATRNDITRSSEAALNLAPRPPRTSQRAIPIAPQNKLTGRRA